MANPISERVQELILLGWTEEGARQYSEKLLKDPGNLFIWRPEYFLIIASISVLTLPIIYWIGFRNNIQINSRKEEIIKSSINKKLSLNQDLNLSLEQLNDLTLLKNKLPILTKTIEKLNKNIEEKQSIIKYLKVNFSDTRIDLDRTIEHFLLPLLLIFELFYRVLILLNKDPNLKRIDLSPNETQNSVELDNNIYPNLSDIELRKNFLMSQKKMELKSMLKGVSKISKLNKSQLVDKILALEFNN